MITLDKVDLPVPLGPIIAWISPSFIFKFKFFKISFSLTLTYKFFISICINPP